MLGVGRRSGGDPHFANVVMLWGNDNAADGTNTFADQSSAARTLTAVGNVQYDTAQAPSGMTSSILYDGADDRITAVSSADFDFAAGDFTAEGMIRFATTVGNHSILEKRATGSSFRWIAIFQIGNALRWFASSNGTSWDIANNLAIGTIATGQWYHWALNRTGSDWTPYLDGVAGAGTASSSATLSFDASTLFNGTDASGLVDFSGWQANNRLTNGVGRYPSAFTPPPLPLPTN